ASGVVEMDASIMDGASGRAGAVTAVRDLVNPVKAARAVMDHTPHILLAGDGADRFCIEQGLDRTTGRTDWYRLPIGVELQETLRDELAHGTVGAVAMDRKGRLAAATSTGGLFGKRAGRVGDTPLIGCGTWADDRVAISCTGLGEYFILNSAAYDIAARMKYGAQSLADAADHLLSDVEQLGGDGGLIGLSAEGDLVLPFNSHGMKRAWVTAETSPEVHVF
ncbi:MAG: isoaspartyl peptidase/L-asparaginase, partial [Pseudomonadota bacterium]